MSASPLVLRPTEAIKPTSTISSPNKHVSNQPSSSATPQRTDEAKAISKPSSLVPTLDLAEQMNEDEKRKYIKGKKLGEGTYAIVFLGRLRSDPSSLVAIKKIKVQKEYREGMAPDAVRELKHLQELHHPNIISLLSVFSSKDQNLNLVLEYLPLGDLEMLIKDTERIRYGAADIKAWMGMLCRAVWFCHENFVLHRDIKPNNLLIAADGEVKLADFGLARSFADPLQVMTSQVITRWYRPPELLFGARHYSGAVDVWSVGCVFAELIIRHPFMPSDTEVQQVSVICHAVGTPREDNWPGVSKLPAYTVPDDGEPPRGRDYFMGFFSTVGPDGVDLLMKTLVLDPNKRITARDMLRHPWWHAQPKPTRKEYLPRKDGGESQMAADLKRRNGILEDDRGSKVARRLDFGK
ncbi:serine/threonine-protein kinase crk1 [Sodiomyces alkalinus F11]|uniref:Serine/threonine-protein kinase crk1 n=1 Tax=Sodiomyces alkalinus (strain CBS 110278 / VKM F-3762 / F11) TaxID=1314773 RepID=A0A3N2Q8M4_SODAK|nr:serine/threonine-protein kinase crk1 [Sodiomyces alkalinus F11]ROT43124.1 serine/threonine-protein kinase crk1 [Sodiomyces alkalinus F11]